MRLGLGLGIGVSAQKGAGVPPIITQTAAPNFGPYTTGQTPADAYSAGTYASTAGTISSAVPQWTINGVAALGTDVLAGADVVGLSVLVTDSAANQRTFGYGTAAAALGPPAVMTAPQWTLQPLTSTAGDQLRVNILAEPANGGSALTEYQFRRNGGAASTLPNGADLGARDITVLATTAANIQVRAINAIGPTDPEDGWSDVKTATPISDAALTLRQQIDGLATGVTPNGRQSVEPLKVAGPGNIPPGCTLSGTTFTFSGDGVTLEDWDFTGYRVDPTGNNQTIQNCYWGPVEDFAPLYFMQVSAACSGLTVRYCTMDGFDGFGGPGTFINMPTTGSGAAAVGPQDWLFEYNRYLHCNGDVHKVSGNGINQWNYYGPITNYPAGTALYNAGTTYALGDYVLSPSNQLYVSLQNGNVGNPLPTTTAGSTAFWDGPDPHGDAITQTASDGVGCIHRFNRFDWDEASVTRAVGVTQCIRIVRNTGSSVFMGPVDFTSNVISAPFEGFYAIQVQHIRSWFSTTTYNLGGFAKVGSTFYVSLQAGNLNNPPETSPAWWAVTTDINAPGPIRFINNWLAQGEGGLYYASSSTDDAIDVWSNNRDTVTDTQVPSPVLRAVPTTLIAAILGQSENVVGIAHNDSFYTAGPYPSLLTGVDAQIANHPLSDSSDVATIRVLDAAAITNRTVNPGFVALANLWHIGSGGRKLRLVSNSVAGTSMTEMMDDADLDRLFSQDAATVALAEAAWGPVARVVYNWWNSEASAAKTLWNSRSAHFFGVNPDGTDYDFNAGPLDHCLIDITGRDKGLLSPTAKLDLMLPGVRIETATALRDPPNLNYRTTSAGAEIFGMIDQNAEPAYAQRDNVLQEAPEINRGVVSISPALVRFGDYSGGVQLTAPAQTAIHPAMKHKDGQQLFGQDIAAHLLIAEGHAQVSRLVRVETINLSTFDFVFSIPAGGILTTQRLLDSETVASPRPHQQQVMGFVVARGADTDRQMRPIYRTDNVDAGLYPVNYRGTVTITNSGTDVAGGREATVRVVMQNALTVGDRIHFGTDGGYGGFILHGYPDYDANLYRDGLRVYEARLSDGTSNRYPGIPVRAQEIYTVVDVPAAMTNTVASNLATWDGDPVDSNIVTSNLAEWN